MSSLEALADPRDLSGYEAFAALDQAVLDAIPAAAYIASVQGTVVRSNRRMIALWGRSPHPDETDGRLWAGWRFCEPDGTPLAQPKIPTEAALRTGRRQSDRELLIEAPDGTRRFVAVDVEPLKDARGAMRGTANFFRDLTGRKRAADRQARDLLDALPAAVYTTDTAGRLTYYNRAAVELWGYSPKLGEARWCGSWKLYWPDGTPLPHDECPMATALKDGRPVRGVEAVAERPDGSRVAFLPFPTPLYDAAGEMTGAVNMLADLSATKGSEYNNALLASIIESSDDAIVGKDLNGIVLSWNDGAERIFGYSAEEAVGKSITFIIPPDRQAEEPEILNRIRRGDRVDHYETVRQRKDGSLIDVSLTISTVRDASGKIVGASKIARDITDRKRAEAMLARQMAEQTTLFRFTDRLHRASAEKEIHDAALDAIISGLRCDRASILLFDDAQRMRFVAWYGLSEDYRNAVDGHSPWTPHDNDPTPVPIDDVASADLPAGLRQAVEAEGIGALAFIPLVSAGRLIGKFMAYHDTRHVFTDAELDFALTLARQIGFTIDRIRAEEARRKTEEQRNLLVAELSHRVKNTLATVTSIARLSFAKNADVAAASRSFDARIRALAQSHGRLAEANWLGVSFDSILRDEFAPYRRPDGANVHISGPPILLNAQSALMLGMVVHELATNAAKHGALSVDSGTVDVAWRIDAVDRQVRIDWTESGGPPVAPPVRTGFGCMLLERALATDLDSDVTLDFARDGFKCVIAMPVAQTFQAAATGIAGSA
jgi:PAS domain S-box-containing protein